MDILYTDNKLCVQCYACVRVCPVNAISFQNGKATIAKEDCILCGSCAKVCSQGAKLLFNDVPMVQKWLDRQEETVAIVAPSFAASFTCKPRQLIGGLRRLGFSKVYETAFGAEICAYQYQKLLSSGQCSTIITTPCPSVVLMVEKHFPQLISCLAPIKSPMMITGEAAKKLYPHCKTVFIGPCIAKKAESVNKHAGTAIDAVITFNQLKQWFKREEIILENMPEENWDSPGANTARLFPLAGGLLKTLGLHRDVGSLDVIEANGPAKCKSILRSINSGFLTPRIVDLLCCDGCIAGREIASSDLCFVKSQRIINYSNEERKKGEYKYPRDFAELAPDIDTSRTFVNKQRIKKFFTRQEIWDVLKKTGKYSQKDLINCGACGYNSCWEKAIAVLQGKADIQMCLPFLLKQYQETSKHMAAIYMLSRNLEFKAATDSLTGLYNHRKFQEELDKQIKKAKAANQSFALFIIDIDSFKRVNDLYGHQVGDQILLQVAVMLRELFPSGFVARYGGEEFSALQPNVSPEEALAMGRRLNQTVKNRFYKIQNNNININLTVSVGIACFPFNATNKDDLLKLADYALYKAKRTKDTVILYSSVLDEISPGEPSYTENDFSTIKTLNIVINAKDHYTYKHSERVVYYAETLARKLGLPEEDIKYLKYGAFLHDIGKIKIDMSILQKPGRLTEEEFERIKQHPLIGADIVREIPTLHNIIPVILYHHERYDGKGYPYGKKGNDIPLLGRIASIADSFDAMTTKRPYKKALNYDQAVNELIRNSGSQFDPELVKGFLCCVKKVVEV
ncbi:diguanylate cyclase (GGDEF)-like protein/putative nucleotidyltransferase with HDIG domain [Desulfohalotomaculum tongense]|uniref:[Fe-Fe] hydrogenase large subunit C-terminal domain-containing protein n=1 Tax=Desulforadius tongensis TaxID=1216062 RepID=UPI00195C22AD|nr:[Fe-Fe] hydrogenase large subunit C-terminal domain-containing protein [Desulforadius tongensis]MBM7854856.1 diguanylate cyclase (GGDEF)-like protein/putative nucleotidyltransferase with HDIG domain [Desulforadius tongensis]